MRGSSSPTDFRLHDLWHSFAFRAPALGESLPMIGKLLGHTQVQTTARYAHPARDSIQNAAARITGSIGSNLVAGKVPHRTERNRSTRSIPFSCNIGRECLHVGGSVRAREVAVGEFCPLVSNPEGVYPPRRRQYFCVSVPESGNLPSRGGTSPIHFATAGETSDWVGDER